jgi:hypothetical protein
MDSSNPYAPPQADLLVTDAEASRVRLEHLRTEGHLKALGWLLLTLAFTQPVTKMLRARFLARMFEVEVDLTKPPMEYLIQSGALLVIGAGLIKLQRWAGLLAAVSAAVLIIMNLLELPNAFLGAFVAIMVNAFILRLLLTAKVRTVFSGNYRSILRLTPLVQSPVARWIRPIICVQAVALAVLWWSYS